MDILDLLLLAAFTTAVVLFIKKKQKNRQENIEAEKGLTNYNALRMMQAGNTPLHGISIVSLYYDSAASYADMEKDGTNTGFDLNCENRVNDVLKSLKADGYSPTLNAVSCVDRVIFYIIY